MKKTVITGLMIALCGLSYAEVKDKKETTIEKIKRTNTITLGNRSSSIPFSYYDKNKKPIGFAIDICGHIVESIKTNYNLPNLEIKYVEVNGDNRVPFVEEGKIDLECGSTTNNAARREKVNFSVPFYIAGVKVMGRTEDKLDSLLTIKNKRVVVVNGTTANKIVENLNKDRLLNLSTVQANDYSSALKAIVDKKADVIIADDILLSGEVANIVDRALLSFVPGSLSVEPLAVMFKKGDNELNTVVNKTLVKIMNGGDFDKLYRKWFLTSIYPSNTPLNIPMSELLFDVVRFPTQVTGN